MSINEIVNQFKKEFGEQEGIRIFFAPGRVNLIGEHIDYNGGFVFPAALTIGITAVCRIRKDNMINMKSLELPLEISVDLNKNIVFEEKDGWGNYPKGVFDFLKKEGKHVAGCDILFSSTLPDGAGLSSSAAIEVVTAFLMLQLTNQKQIDLTWLALFAQRVENKFVGVNCGIMDQFSVAHGKANNAILLNCETLEFQHVHFHLQEYSLVVMNTNKKRELAESKYNERRAECDEALAILNTKNNYPNLCSADLAQVEELLKDDVLKKRARHVITENHRVLKAIELLNAKDIHGFGRLLNESHRSLQHDYEVTGTELDTIVEESWKFSNCLGARMTGAGFGGCAIAIVKNDSVKEFIEIVHRNYQNATGITPEFYSSLLGDGVHEILQQ